MMRVFVYGLKPVQNVFITICRGICVNLFFDEMSALYLSISYVYLVRLYPTDIAWITRVVRCVRVLQ